MENEFTLFSNYEGTCFQHNGVTYHQCSNYIESQIPKEGVAAVLSVQRLWGFVDFYGNEVIPCQFSFVYSFSEGLAAVRKDNKWGYVDRCGNEIIAFKYDEADDFIFGFASVKVDGLSYLIDKDGRFVSKAYSRIDFPTEGLRPALSYDKYNNDNKWGFIDYKGNEVGVCRYSFVSDFQDGMALVKSGNNIGYINTSGVEVIPPIYEEGRDFSAGLAAVKFNGKWGFINKYGEFKIACCYSNADSFSLQFNAVLERIKKEDPLLLPIGVEPGDRSIAWLAKAIKNEPISSYINNEVLQWNYRRDVLVLLDREGKEYAVPDKLRNNIFFSRHLFRDRFAKINYSRNYYEDEM